MNKIISAIVAVAIAAVGAYFWNLTQALGAHPFWAEKVLFIGAPIGLIVGLTFSRIPYVVSIAVLLAATIISFGVAHWGKTQFAASYAEDAFAGQMWYFGWFAVCITATSLLARVIMGKN
jgi:hypothetical protein